MDDDFSLQSLQDKLTQLEGSFSKAMQKIQTGRAHPSILDDVLVAIEDDRVAISRIATILTLDAQTLKIIPFDNQQINSICEAISQHPRLNLNPHDDGRLIYVPLPPLTTENRQLLVKNLQQQREEFLIQLRHHRHDILKDLKRQVKAEDQARDWEKQVETLVNKTKETLTKLTEAKTKEIMAT